ncbi:MAG: TIGR03067 domain-containing protein [Planctomycetes bacterium]|nr:TIGR03067 domain-containing protein [Planctomycetota bacterium]
MGRTLMLMGFLFITPAGLRSADPEKPKDALDSAQIGKLLKELGHEPVMLTAEVHQISMTREGWKVHVMVSLTADGERVWLESKFAPIAEPALVPASAWLRLLEENERIGPAHFSFDKLDKRIHLYKAFDNVAVTAVRLKKELESFDAVVRKTQHVWRIENFTAAETLPVPRTIDVEQKKLSKLEGKWRIVRIETRGESITEERLIDKKPTLVIEGENVTIKTGIDPEKRARVRIDDKSKPAEIDFTDEKGRVEAGIFSHEVGLLMICVAGAGEPRPRQFITEANSKLWLMVLKRDE